MPNDALTRRIHRLFRTLVIGAAVIAPHAGCDSTTEPTATDAATPDDDAGANDGGDTDGGGAHFW